ncbi:hypothetical protein [Exiguobacterium aurantiacum]|uniref:Uncharacterized protein n=1 Tax=Exiguobacterium aurantiacum TaxID=33987 RepID=A0A377FQI6_9BACL|nr:hypothetical protein [Exiguobacterium aurantiacum]STO07099.1 Uncharacterised protein [Exiguobacterium aurantiacum]
MKYIERQTELFWRVFYVLAAIMLIGLAFMITIAPLVLIWLNPAPYMIPLLSIVALGGFGVYWFFNMFRQLFWKERHRSHYEITATHLDGVTWRVEPGESVEQSIRLGAIEQVVFFPAIVRKTQPSPTVPIGRPTIDFCPMLAIMTADESVEILFDPRDLDQFDRWIAYFHERGTPLYYTPKWLYWIGANIATREERFALLNEPDELIPFVYTGDIPTDEATAATAWIETYGIERQREGPHETHYVKQAKIMKWTALGTVLGIALLAASMLGIAAFT